EVDVGVEAHRLLGAPYLLDAQWIAVRLGAPLECGCSLGDPGLAADQSRAVLDGTGLLDGGGDRLAIVAVDREGVPAERLEALGHVVGESDRRRAVDRDLV